MKQVLIRRPQLHGNLTKLIQGDVISEDGPNIRVKIKGEIHPVEVKAKDTLPVQRVAGGMRSESRQLSLTVPKCYPVSPHALGNRLRGE